MLPALSVENRINEKIGKLNCTVNFIAALSGISNTKLSNALNGIKPLLNNEGLAVNKLCDDLLEFCAEYAPVPIELRNAGLIKEILRDWQGRRKGRPNVTATLDSMLGTPSTIDE